MESADLLRLVVLGQAVVMAVLYLYALIGAVILYRTHRQPITHALMMGRIWRLLGCVTALGALAWTVIDNFGEPLQYPSALLSITCLLWLLAWSKLDWVKYHVE